jgi:hypothetical protein
MEPPSMSKPDYYTKKEIDEMLLKEEVVEGAKKLVRDFNKLLAFVKAHAAKGCCFMCECKSCNAVALLKEIGEIE